MQGNSSLNDQSFTAFRTPQQQKWEDPSLIEYSTRLQSSLSKLNQPPENSSLLNGMSNNQLNITNQEDIPMNQMLGTDRTQVWNPRAVLSNLIFLEQKIHQLQELVHMLVGQKGHVPGNQDEVVTQHQQLITADVTSIVIQLISMAGSLLPSVKQNPSAATTSAVQLNALLFPSHNNGGQVQQTAGDVRSSEKSKQMDVNGMTDCNMEEDHELKDDGNGKEEHLPPGSYEILQLEKEEILAPHTHFCTICGKGFK